MLFIIQARLQRASLVEMDKMQAQAYGGDGGGEDNIRVNSTSASVIDHTLKPRVHYHRQGIRGFHQ